MKFVSRVSCFIAWAGNVCNSCSEEACLSMMRWIVSFVLFWLYAGLASAEIPPFPGSALITNSSLTVHTRLYYLNRHFDTPHTQESLALGGWVSWESGQWHGLSFGLTPYTSQRIVGSDEHDGASLLQPGQQGYTVLGQAYARWRGWDNQITLYRQILETPLLNTYDAKMTPVTFEAYTFENRSITNLTLTLSQVEKIKPWTESSFRSLSDAAGYDNTSDGITLAGVSWTCESLTLQAWEYYAHNLVNSVYAQADLKGPVTGLPAWSLSAQGLSQQDVGAAYAGEIRTGMGGIMGGLAWKGITLTAGGTITDNGADIFNPWASYPGYTSLMEEDCNMAGEKAWMMGLAYDFAGLGLEGVSAFMNHSEAWTSKLGSLSDPEQIETNFTADYRPGGLLRGLGVRARAAFVRNSLCMNGTDYEDFRIIVDYECKVF